MFRGPFPRFNRVSGFIASFVILTLFLTSPVMAERIFFAGYKGGFYIRSEEDGGMELRLGGAFQSDYRYYLEDERGDNRFDIRRARLRFRGALTKWFRFGMEYEFQGNTTSNLVDAWADGVYGPHALRFGQFKEPFSLEWQTRDKGLFFAERSMGYSLSPGRDLGLMFHGSFAHDMINYGVGVFNGDGDDGATRGNETDDPEVAGRLVIAPFKNSKIDWLSSLQFGGSVTYATIDTANINIKVKSSGMYGGDDNIYVLNANTKFGMIHEVDSRQRAGIEAAWAWGPVALQGEYMKFTYTDLKPASGPVSDLDLSTWYASAHWCVTGEPLILTGGTMKPVYPDRFFNPEEGTWGALCLSARLEHFEGDEDWINPQDNVSTREANGLSLSANWILFPMVRMIFDYSHTKFSDPIKVRVNNDGSIDTIDEENAFTMRFSMDF